MSAVLKFKIWDNTEKHWVGIFDRNFHPALIRTAHDGETGCFEVMATHERYTIVKPDLAGKFWEPEED